MAAHSRRNYAEGRLHMRIVRTLNRIEGILFYHPPNEALRTPRIAMTMHAFGTSKAAPDLFIFGIEGKQLKPICVELKRPGGKASEEQTAWLTALESMGWRALVIDNYESMLDELQEHGYIDAEWRNMIWEDEEPYVKEP